MPLPAPDLDDRRFQDFVDEAKRLLQQRIPTWTDHNVHDPGITLIEAVATIADQLSYRLNQVPERNYRKFLDLLGITLRPPMPAHADLTFRLAAPVTHPVVIPAGTTVSSRRIAGTDPVTFTTVRNRTVPPVTVTDVRALSQTEGALIRDLAPLLAEQRSASCFSPVPRVGDHLAIGLSAAAPDCVVLVRLDCSIDGIGVDPERPPLRWEASTARGWQPCELESDSTGGLNQPGDVLLHVPTDHRSVQFGGTVAGWVRAVVVESPTGRPAYSSSPRLRGAAAHAVGVTAPAIHAEHVGVEILGRAEGTPGQLLHSARRPMLADPEPTVQVGEQDGWVTWSRVGDFAGSTPTDRHYLLDPAEGTVQFGPAVRLADGSMRSHGLVPPESAQVRILDYWTGGGAAGNVSAGALCVLRSSIPFVRSVGNRAPAVGGRDGETVDEAKLRAPRVLRSRDRAVSSSDFELFAGQAAGGTARVRCVPPAASGEPVRILVVPDLGGYAAGRMPFIALRPSAEVLDRIRAALEPRRLVGVSVTVEPPRYQGVTVAARVRARPTAATEQVHDAVERNLYQWLHPSVGGPDGAGWPFGRPVTIGDLHSAVSRVPGVDYVEELLLFPADPITGTRSQPTQHVRLEPDMLPFSYQHQIQVRL